MDTVILSAVVLLTIVVAQLSLRRIKWVEFAPILNIILAAIVIIGASILFCAAIGNQFYEVIIIATVFAASMIQINYTKRLQRYQQTGK